MTKNIGRSDRLLRLGIGLVFLGAAFLFNSTVLALFGLFSLFQAVTSWCILYQMVGKNTCSLNNSASKQTVPLLKYYLSGIGVLLTAIILNLLASYLGWLTWYDILSLPNTLSQVTLDNWLFLLFFYPLALGLSGKTIYKKSKLR